MTDPVPTEAAATAYAEFQRLYPQRSAPWEELAEWERERWLRILAAASPVLRAAERQQVIGEIEAEAATHLFSIRRSMRWAVWAVRGKPAGDDPANDFRGRRAPGMPCCPVETAAVDAAAADLRGALATAEQIIDNRDRYIEQLERQAAVRETTP
jgi:hypothetical protein